MIAADEQDRPMVAWTLSLLPALVGLLGIVLLVVGSILSGITDGSQGWTFTMLAAVLVATTVVGGSSYGLYLALLISAIGGLVVDGGPSTFELVVLMLTLLIVHEVIRFSVDARRPSRFGPGLITRYLWRTVAVGLFLIGLAVAAEWLIDRAPTAPAWVPIGVAVAALPLFVLFGAERLSEKVGLDRPLVRAVLGALLTVAIIALVVIGAQARNEISSSAIESDPARSVATAPATTTTVPEDGPAESTRTLPSWMVLVVVGLIGLFIYLMLRRPEAIFQLEEIEQPAEASSFELGVVGLADTEAELVSLDEEALARLLGDLQLDISAERDPGRAIRFGYARIEQRLAELGVERADTETEREFLARAMGPLGSAAEAMTSLTRLFERARFGHDPIDETMRQQALGAIDDLITATSRDNGRPVDGGRRS